ncbi:MAG TPA: AEC family transporter [Methylophilaceae bacterium]|nr:AEC family transporter [Methylophilaceae bacterium]
MNEPVTTFRIISIVFPVFAVALIGWFYGRKRNVDMTAANETNMDIFVPALVFSALADRSFDLAGHWAFAIGAFFMIVGSGLIAWFVARLAHIETRVLVPTAMFNNNGNLGLPLAYLAFGAEGLSAAVVMFMVGNLMHFSFGNWYLDRHAKWWNAWRYPVILAALAGLAVSFSGVEIWEPLRVAIKMLGDVSIPLALFALGVRIAQSRLTAFRVGFIGAIVRPASGILLTWMLANLLGLQAEQKAMLIIFGALPPAVINYVFAERYNQGPDEVSAIVLIGNIAAVLVIPVVLAVVL